MSKRIVQIEVDEQAQDVNRYPMVRSRTNSDWEDMVKKAFDDYFFSNVSADNIDAFKTLTASVFRILGGTFQRRNILNFAASSLLKHNSINGQVILQEVEMSPGPYSSDGYPAIYGQLLVIQDNDNKKEIFVSIDSIVESVLGNKSQSNETKDPENL